MNRITFLVLLMAAPLALFSKAPMLKDGRVVAIDVKDLMAGKKLEHRWVCTVSDGEYNYVVEYEKPVKLAVNDPVKFELKKDKLTLIDADGKKRETKLEKRERLKPAAEARVP
jgi:hypothetical protein